MKSKLILSVLLACCVQWLWAQSVSLYDGMYSKQWTECRDKLLYKKINVPNFYTPVNGLRIEREQTRVSTGKRAAAVSRSKSGYKSYSVGSRSNNVSHYGELRQQWIQQARRQETERKRRIAAENAADRQIGFARHTAMMSGFYSQKFARDQYLMGEGARELDESVRAMDFSNVPEQKVEVMKGEELADILKEYKLIIDKEQPLLKNKQFKAGEKLNVTANLEMDEEVLEKWDMASMETNIVDMRGKKSNVKTKEPEILVSKDEICLDSVDLFILPRYGLVMQTDDGMRVLKDYELRPVVWEDGKQHSYIVPCGDRLIGRDNRALYDIRKDNSTKILEFDTPDFSLFAGNDSTVYCVFWYEDISSIYKVDVVKHLYDEIVRLPDFVWKIESNGKQAFVMIDNSIFVLSRRGMPHMFYKSDDYINDVVLSPWGILIATDKEIIRVTSANDCETFYPITAKHLWCDGYEVYIQSEKGDLLYMENGADYITN